MAECELCGKDCDTSLEVVVAGQSHNFDRLECAIQALATDLRALREEDPQTRR